MVRHPPAARRGYNRGMRVSRHFDINEQGCSIRCKLYCDDPAAVARAVVACHGFGGHKDGKAIETFAERICGKWPGTAVAAFDWPCHGDDARKNLALADCEAYLRIVCGYVQRRFGTGELYAYGTSFGAFMLLEYIAAHGMPFRRMALRCSVIDMLGTFTRVNLTQDDLRRIRAGKAMLVGFDRKVKVGAAFLEELEAVDIAQREYFAFADDIIMVHGTADEVAPFDEAAAFADANVIEFVAIDGADHRFRDPRKMDAAIARIIAFFMG